MRRCARWIATLILLSGVTLPASATQRVGLFVPHLGNFWGQFVDFTQHAADDIGLDLAVYVAERSPERMLRQVRDATDAGIDGILFADYEGIGKALLDIAEASATPALLVNAGLLDPAIVPRVQYRYWIGGVFPDDREVGIRLTTSLLAAASSKGAEAFYILAYAGSKELPMVRRLAGLRAVVDARADVHLIETLYFNEGEAADAFDHAIARHPELNIVWSFYDEFALAAARRHRATSGGDTIVFGGVNWSDTSMDGLEQGLLDIDLGGQIFDGAQGAIMLYDYLNGHDFSGEGLLFDSPMVAATPDNVAKLRYLLDDPEGIDYQALSKTHNPDLKQYRFDLNEIAERTALAEDVAIDDRQTALLQLTREEQAWLAEHPVIRVGADPDRLPYEAIDSQGGHIGSVPEYLDLIARKLGIAFESVTSASWGEIIAGIEAGDIDMFSADDDPAHFPSLRFTTPYLVSPVVIVMRDTQDYVEQIAQIKDKCIAVIAERAYASRIRSKYPRLDYRVVDRIQDGLTAVSTGAADALFSPLAEASYYIAELGINNVRIVGKTEFETRLAFGVRDELAPLVPMLERALDTIGAGTRQRILETWGRQRYAAHTDYRRIASVILVASAAILLILRWNYSIRRQKERLRVSEERFQLAMDAASVGLWDWNAKTDKVYYSPLWMSMLGYDEGELPATFETFRNLLHPDDREGVLCNNTRMLDDPTATYEQEFRLRAKDGSYRWILSRGHVFSRDGEGKALRALGTHTDITRRKLAELDAQRLNRGLLAANRRFAMAARAISLGVWERIDGSDRLCFDVRLLRMYGMDWCDSVSVRDWLKRVHPDDRHLVAAGIHKVLREGGDAQADFRAYHSDGSLRYIYGAISSIRGDDDQPDQLFGVNWDITARKNADKQFERVLDVLPVAVAITDLRGRVLRANTLARREIGEVRRPRGSNLLRLFTRPRQRRELIDILSKEGRIVGYEIQYRDANGAIFEGILSALRIDYDERPVVLGVMVNITERRQMERELARAKSQAEEANRFKGQFLANMSHEIRTPMNAIVGIGHLMNRTPLTPTQQDYLGKIQISAQSLLNIIDDILDLSKIEAGQLHIEHIDFNLGDVLDNIATLAGTRLADKPIEFLYDVGPGVPSRLRGDPHRLAQILTNLVGNAVKFTHEGSIVVRIRALEQEYPLLLGFSVEDTGVGIASSKMERLFSPFVQADGSTTREYGGTGLGLSICRQLAELMGGSIGAKSTFGKGSRFEFYLPFAVPAAAAPKTVGSYAKGLRVLLVDDNAIARQVIADLLLSLSFRVDVAASGAAAIDKLTSEGKRYDLMLLDWRMPELDGFDTARRVRAEALAQQPRIMLMTAYGRDAAEQAIDPSVIDAFLVKPITPAHLLDTVARLLAPDADQAQDDQPARTGDVGLARLSGRVLLVEDNPINQQVARELLEQMGLAVRVCDGGAEALSMLERMRVDLVLMDIQMPDMDGYETTARIRAMHGTASLPIIAMTANAMVGDAERSMAAGMNGHISKPVDPVLMHTTLARWLATDAVHGAEPSADAATRTPVSSPDESTRTPLHFEEGVLRAGGNRALYVRLLDDFVQRYEDTLARLQAFRREDRRAEAERLLHTLKGVAGNLGADDLRQAADRLERHWHDGVDEAVAANLETLRLALDATLEVVRSYLEPHREAGTHADRSTDETRIDLGALLDELDGLLVAGDAAALERLDGLSTARFDTDTRLLADQLFRQVRDYDFEAARHTLASLSRALGLDTPSAPQ